jgi:hypothetical protein
MPIRYNRPARLIPDDLDRQCLALLEEWTPKSRMVQ